MNVQVVGCSHRVTSLAVRERLAFSGPQAEEALDHWRRVFRPVEAVLLSTCNRVEVYTAGEEEGVPTPAQVAGFLARFHHLDPQEVSPHLYHRLGREAVRHLFMVAASLDSMVVGEAQILAQVKQAYQAAVQHDNAGPLLHAAFQAAIRAARRVAGETTIHQRRVSIPSVAVGDFAQQIFEHFGDKETLVLGAGEIAEETLRYLRAAGASRITVLNRHFERAAELARQWGGAARPWEELPQALAAADVVISATAAGAPLVTRESYQAIGAARPGRPLFILDLAVPRDFDPAIGELPEVYLYSLDDLQAACQRNLRQRDKELPAAMKIIDQETDLFMGDLHHRATGEVIRQLKEGWQKPKEQELERLLAKLPQLDERQRAEVRRSFDRLLNKLLHPPLESLRDESRQGIPHVLLDALARLFKLKD